MRPRKVKHKAPDTVSSMLPHFHAVSVSIPRNTLSMTVNTTCEGCHAAADTGSANIVPVKEHNWSKKMKTPGSIRRMRRLRRLDEGLMQALSEVTGELSSSLCCAVDALFRFHAVHNRASRIGDAVASRIRAKRSGLMPAPERPSLLTTAAEPQQNCVRSKAPCTAPPVMAPTSGPGADSLGSGVRTPPGRVPGADHTIERTRWRPS
mmetsp:Transcript_109185/g.314498  ORF Transcript_109185/g.314498 Transcript_109185/m.314498 type:complete len:207 (-) Transcript_109185:3-623(-)